MYDASALALSLYFYHPLVPYDSLPDDLPRLSGAGPHTVAEVALSLDRLYQVSEILSLLPPGVDARRYAVNIWPSGEEVPGSGVPSGPDGSDRVNLPITYGLVGFPAFPGLYCSQRDDGSAFLEALGCLARTRGTEQRLFRQVEGYVREHGLQVFGVVVTGKASDLLLALLVLSSGGCRTSAPWGSGACEAVAPQVYPPSAGEIASAVDRLAKDLSIRVCSGSPGHA
ncbi:MAG: anti sigma factor C-terminal domain-containing protein [Bacillota bacterium]|nr:anti sigma factor C-terminal domain-containing protein [Bacillota bacterium]